MRMREVTQWRIPQPFWFWLVAVLVLTDITGATQKVTSLEEDDAIVIEVEPISNDISNDPKNIREKRQLGFPGFGTGFQGFPPGWPFVNGVNKPISVSPQLPQFPGFPSINNHLHPLQPTHPPTTAAPPQTPPPLGSLGPCVTNNGLTGYCASFRQCYPIVYSPDDGHIMNHGLAEMYMNNSGSCNGQIKPNFFMFRADARLRQNQICCSGSVASQPSFPQLGFPNFPFHNFPQITQRPPFGVPQRTTTTTSTTTTTTTTTRRPTTTQQTRPPWVNPWQTSTTSRYRPQNPWGTTSPTQAPPSRPTTTTISPVASSCGVSKIVGGSQAVKGEFPWLIAIVRNGRQVCGGSLIDNQFILTAAHCFNGVTAQELQSLFKVYIGDYDLHTLSDGPMTVKSVSKLLIHRQFHQQFFYNDIALLKLDSPVQFGSNGNNDIKPICLSTGGNYEGQSAVVAGWGRTSVQNTYQPGTYRKVELQVWNLNQCAAKYGHNAPGGITRQMMCAGSTNRDSCLGDSGGPLMRRTGNGWEQIGIVSWGIDYPGVYTRIADYQDWISRHRHS